MERSTKLIKYYFLNSYFQFIQVLIVKHFSSRNHQSKFVLAYDKWLQVHSYSYHTVEKYGRIKFWQIGIDDIQTVRKFLAV